MNEVAILKQTVIDGGYCIGCGACASVENSPFEIKFDPYKKLQATLADGVLDVDKQASVLDVCPFSDTSKNEDELAAPLFGVDAKKNDKIGYHLQTFAGYVSEDGYRQRGSSGGVGSWILMELLEQGFVDRVIHIKETKQSANKEALFEYQMSDSVAEVKRGAKSRYYPIELSEVVRLIKNTPGRYAIVGIPCFIKSIRLLSLQDVVLKERVSFCIGLICGHLKSAHFASMFGWQLDVHPNDLNKIDFRTKLPNSSAIYYGVTAGHEKDGKQSEVVSRPVNELYGSNWGWGVFKYKACDFCDDVLAETADLTIGDAWLPRYMDDHEGTNVLVVRNKELLNLIKKAKSENRLSLEDLSVDEVIQSQRAGLAHRREGLAYRLHKTDQEGVWRPKKRVQPSLETLDEKKKKIQDLRIILRDKSHTAFQEALKGNDFEIFKSKLAPYIRSYQLLYRPGLIQRIKIRARLLIKKFS